MMLEAAIVFAAVVLLAAIAAYLAVGFLIVMLWFLMAVWNDYGPRLSSRRPHQSRYRRR